MVVPALIALPLVLAAFVFLANLGQPFREGRPVALVSMWATTVRGREAAAQGAEWTAGAAGASMLSFSEA
jgi:hypothetical protein